MELFSSCYVTDTYHGFPYERIDGDLRDSRYTPHCLSIFLARDHGSMGVLFFHHPFFLVKVLCRKQYPWSISTIYLVNCRSLGCPYMPYGPLLFPGVIINVTQLKISDKNKLLSYLLHLRSCTTVVNLCFFKT